MIIVTMMTDHDNDNSHHADEHGDEHVMNMFDVWSARLGHSRPLPAALPAPPTHKLRTKIPDHPPGQLLPE